jgi:4-amino-4-deoxy-L-arabinose transferase-like glycosyltransferase
MERFKLQVANIAPSTWLISIITVSVVLRIAAACVLGDRVVDLPGTNDQLSYHALALRLLSGYGFSFGEAWWPATQAGTPTAHWSFLYTYYLAGVYTLFDMHPLAARLIQALLVGVLQPLLAYLIGFHAFNRTVGLVAAGLTAVYAYFIYYSAVLMTEPFYIVTILLSLYIGIQYVVQGEAGSHRRSKDLLLGILLGLSLAATVLFRQIFLLFLPFLFPWMWWVRRKRSGSAPLLPLLIAIGILFLAILPFTVYNYARFHRFVLLNTNAGYAFFFGNHPIYGTRFIPILSDETGGYQALIPDELIGLDEAALEQELMRRGIGFVQDDLIRYLRLSLSRIPVYFMFWPSRDSGLVSNLARVTSFGLLWPFMLYGVVLSFLIRPWSLSRLIRAPAFLLQMFIVIYTAIHVLTWTLVRYRIPVDALLVIFAGLAIVDLFERLTAWRSRNRFVAGKLEPGMKAK